MLPLPTVRFRQAFLAGLVLVIATAVQAGCGAAGPPSSSPVEVESDCARVDQGADGIFSVCALRGSGESGACVVRFRTTGDSSLAQAFVLELNPQDSTAPPITLEPPGEANPPGSAIVVPGQASATPAGPQIDSAKLEPHTIYEVSLKRSPDAPATVVGFIGLCDPGGRVKIVTGGPNEPLPVFNVTLYQLPSGTLNPGVIPTPGNCQNTMSRPTALDPPVPPPVAAYWNNWSGVTIPTPTGGVTPVPPLNPPASMQTTTAQGVYGWIAQPGCYYVQVVPQGSELPTAISPVVGSVSDVDLLYRVNDLDLTYYK